MEKKQVMQLFEATQAGNTEAMIELIEDVKFKQRIKEDLSRQSTEEETNKLTDELIKVLLMQIKASGEYEYFETLGLKQENQEDFIYMFQRARVEISIETANRYLAKLKDASNRSAVIKATKNPKYIRQCVEDDSLGLDIYEKSELVALTGDSQYIHQFLKENSQELFPRLKVKLIKATKDPNYIKQCIETDRFKIRGLSLASLIIATGDIEYIKKCNEDDRFYFETNERVELVAATKDVNYINEYLKSQKIYISEDYRLKLVGASENPDYMKQCIENETIGTLEGKVILIQLTHDSEYIKRFIERNWEDLEEKDKIQLIKATGDTEYIKQCIYNKILTEAGEIDLILYIKDEDFLIQCITDDTIGMTMAQKIILSQLSSDGQLKQQFVKQYEPDLITHKIELPEGITIGIEIEAEGKFSRFLEGGLLDREIFEGWKAKHDSSLKDGVEIVSPILKGTENDSKNIHTICRMLNAIGGKTSPRCGGHIHIGAGYLSGKDSYVNLLILWSSAEKILYEISNPPGEIPRKQSVQSYALPISGKIEEALEKGSIDITTDEDLTNFINGIKTIQNNNKHSGINFLNVNLNKKNTIEFRLPNGTIDPKIWIENINLFGGIVKASEELAQIQRKPEELRTHEEKEKIKLFERLSCSNLTEEEILDILLTLSVGKDKKKIYEQRYKINSSLVKNDPELEDQFKLNTAKRPISKRSKKGDFTGTNIQKGQEILESR